MRSSKECDCQHPSICFTVGPVLTIELCTPPSLSPYNYTFHLPPLNPARFLLPLPLPSPSPLTFSIPSPPPSSPLLHSSPSPPLPCSPSSHPLPIPPLPSPLFNRATEAFQKVLQLAPNFARSNEIHLHLGVMCKMKGETAAGLQHFQKALSIPGPSSLSKFESECMCVHTCMCVCVRVCIWG